MTKEKLISFWIEGSDKDFESMLHMFESKDYHWSLYVGHLVIEKLLKAIYVKNINNHVPFIHDLLKLALKSNIEIDEKKRRLLNIITTFNLQAKYDEYKYEFYKKSTKDFASLWIENIKRIREWIKKELLN